MLRPVADLATFARLQLTSKDIDPVYPVLKELERDMPAEQALWCTFLYLAYYNIASGWEAFCRYPEPVREVAEEFRALPIALERRNLRGGNRLRQHVASLYDMQLGFGSIDRWLKFHLRANEDQWNWNWDRLFYVGMHVWGNGRWATYKMCEVLQKVHGFPLKANTMGNEFSSGPRQGMALFRRGLPLGNSKVAITLLDAFAEDLRTELRIFHGVELEIEELETMLCNMHALADGHYYSGHDIDEMQGVLLASPNQGLMEPIWRARSKALPHRYLGEISGWNGVDKRRMKVYKNMGSIIGR